MRVFITGGAGYIGSLLVPFLLADGHRVVVYDTMWFAEGLSFPDNENVKVIKGDIRDANALGAAAYGAEAVIHLAGLTNNDCCNLDERFAASINHECFEDVVMACKAGGVKRFIFPSSVAAYGSSDYELEEDDALAPTTLYGSSKALCESILLNHATSRFCCVILRAATVVGYAPRMRFDTTMNKMVRDAVMTGKVTVNGGSQKRSFIHMGDLIDVFRLMLTAEDVCGEIYNVVGTNYTVMEAAQIAARHSVSSYVDLGNAEIETKPYTDNRSYAVSGEKLAPLWTPKLDMRHACSQMAIKFRMGLWKDAMTNSRYMTMYDANNRPR